jgi:hypothetical protein
MKYAIKIDPGSGDEYKRQLKLIDEKFIFTRSVTSPRSMHHPWTEFINHRLALRHRGRTANARAGKNIEIE